MSHLFGLSGSSTIGRLSLTLIRIRGIPVPHALTLLSPANKIAHYVVSSGPSLKTWVRSLLKRVRMYYLTPRLFFSTVNATLSPFPVSSSVNSLEVTLFL